MMQRRWAVHRVWVQQMAELADAVGEARAGAGEVGVAVDHEPAGVRGDALAVEVGGTADGLVDAEAAGRDDDDLGFGSRDVVPGRRVRRSTGLAEEGLAARRLDHLGQPVAGHERPPGGSQIVVPLRGRAYRGCMLRRTVLLIAAGALLAGCGGVAASATPASLPTSSPAVTALPPTASPGPIAIASPIVGVWVGRHECQGIADALAAAGFDLSVILENIVGNGLIPGVDDPSDVADVATACAAATPLEHSHEFTAGGQFFSYDQNDEEVDSAAYRLVDNDTVEIGSPAVAFDFKIEGDRLTLEPQGLPAGCLEFECQWALMVAMPWSGMERAPG